jgi:putative transposase
MKTYTPGHIYHVYNRGNNKQTLFYNRDNYLFFLKKVRQHIRPHCEIINYSLMPNHFHFLIYANEHTITPAENKDVSAPTNYPNKTKFTEGLRIALSSYTQAINKQEQRTGSLFTQNTKRKQVSDDWMSLDYRICCFSYIHQNPVSSNLVNQAEDLEFSSYRDYVGLRNGTLCNIELGFQLMRFDRTYFDELALKKWDSKIVGAIF